MGVDPGVARPAGVVGEPRRVEPGQEREQAALVVGVDGVAEGHRDAVGHDGIGRLKPGEVVRQDREVDAGFKAAMRQLITYMMEDPRTISSSLDLLFVARSIERIGDHAKNISEYVVYLVKGRDVPHIGLEAMEKEVARQLGNI